jgi:hypothetical protein
MLSQFIPGAENLQWLRFLSGDLKGVYAAALGLICGVRYTVLAFARPDRDAPQPAVLCSARFLTASNSSGIETV